MFSDHQELEEHGNSIKDKNITQRAGDNIAKITKQMECQDPAIAYMPLDQNTYAQYCKEKDTIFISEKYRGVDAQEPALLTPLIAHERIHAEYQSGAPADEASLQEYVDEEMVAYRAEYETWLQIKDDFYQKYPTPRDRAELGTAGEELVEKYRGDLELQVEELGWEKFRQRIEDKYRARMAEKKPEK